VNDRVLPEQTSCGVDASVRCACAKREVPCVPGRIGSLALGSWRWSVVKINKLAYRHRKTLGCNTFGYAF
jgi:hypothetical protein